MSRDWPVGPHEPYWQTNTSFSPPPSRWDFRFQSEALSFGSPDGTQLHGSSASSQSRESRSWMRKSNLVNHQFMVSDTAVPYFSSPSDISPAQQWTPTTIREISTDEYDTSRRDVILGSLSFSPRMEDTSEAGDSGGSTSLRSESSCDYESMVHCPSLGDLGALHMPISNRLLSLNWNRFGKHLSLQGNPAQEFPGKLRKIGSFSSPRFVRSAENLVSGSLKTR